MRHPDTTEAQKAANWAANFASTHSTESYGFGSDIYSPYTDTYCSKIVWDAYYYGASVTLKNEPIIVGGSVVGYASLPYNFLDTSSAYGYNYLVLADDSNW